MRRVASSLLKAMAQVASRPRISAALMALPLLFVAAPGFAFCRTTTCEPTYSCAEFPGDCCIRDGQGCDTNGLPLAWPTSCVSYSIQKDGSTKRNIGAADLDQIVASAFEAWTSVTCGTSPPSLSVQELTEATCRVSEFNRCTSNANVWMFRDSGWSGESAEGSGGGFDSSALAVTTVNFSVKTAQLYDADVELNSDQADFNLPSEAPSVDLLSIVTHEAGHFLGFDHSHLKEATMFFSYAPRSIDGRTLSEDDMAVMCATYPQGRDIPGGGSCEPRRGFDPECHPEDDEVETCEGIAKSGGCAVGRARGIGPTHSAAALAVLGVGMLLARRNRKPA